jgi:MFS family permease
VGTLETLFGDDADLLGKREFQVLLFASVSSPLGTSVVSPMLDSLTGPYGVSEAEIGLLLAAFTAPAIVTIPLVGMLSDRYGRKPILTAGLALFGVSGVSLAFTTDFRAVLGLRLLQGVAYTGIGPVLITAVGDLYTGDREASAQGLRFTTVGLSLTLFPLLAGLLVTVAWQYPFAIFGIALPTALFVHLFFEEPSDGDADADADNGPRALLAHARNGRVLATLVGRAVPSVLWFAFLTYNSIVVVRLLGGTPGQAGALVALASVASSVGSTQLGRLTARAPSRTPLFLGSIACFGVGVTAIALAPSVVAAGAGATVSGAGFGTAITLFRSEITGLASTDLRGGLVSLGETVGRVGSTGTPIVMGGAIALMRGPLGFERAVRVAILGATAFAVVVGTTCVVLAHRLPAPAGAELSEPADD